MARYVSGQSRPLFVETPLWDDQRASLTPDLCVDGEKVVDTGLVTSTGRPIMRVNDPIGFRRG